MRRVNQRGSSAVEMALAVPVLVSLFLGTFQFGYGYYIYNELEQSVRAGARFASIQTFDGTGDNWQTIVQNTQNVVIYGDPNPANGATPIVKNLTAANVIVTPAAPTARPATVKVQIRNYSVGTFWTLIPDNKPATQFPYLGIYTGS